LNLDFVDYIIKTIKHPSIDTDGISRILNVFENLIVNKKFCQKFLERCNIESLLSVFIYNSFSIKIIEKSTVILLKISSQSKTNIVLMGIYGVNDYILNMLTKYMTTCHITLIKQLLE